MMSDYKHYISKMKNPHKGEVNFDKNTHKLKIFRFRISIPEKTSWRELYVYQDILDNIVNQFVKMKKKNHSIMSGCGRTEGYDSLRGKYFELALKTVTPISDLVTEKITWIDY